MVELNSIDEAVEITRFVLCHGQSMHCGLNKSVV